MKIKSIYFETLIRESETLRVLESVADVDIFITDKLVKAILGIGDRESEKVPEPKEAGTLPFVDLLEEAKAV